MSENLDKSVSAERESGTPFTTIPSSDLIGLFLSKQLAVSGLQYTHMAQPKGTQALNLEERIFR